MKHFFEFFLNSEAKALELIENVEKNVLVLLYVIGHEPIVFFKNDLYAK